MRGALRGLTLVLFSLTVVLLAGCATASPATDRSDVADPPASQSDTPGTLDEPSGDGLDDAPSDEPADPPDAPADAPADPSDGAKRASSPQEALALSAQRSGAAESFQGTFTMKMGTAGFAIETGGEYAFEAPDRMYMTMEIFGQQIETLMLGPQLYVRVPGDGWYVSSLEDLGLDWEVYSDYLEQQGPVDYQAMVEELYGLEQTADETIDGVTYLHYKGELDLEALMAGVPSDMFDPSLLDQMGDIDANINVEFWLHQDSYLPYQVKMFWEMGMPGQEDFLMEMTMVYLDYNEPVHIPAPPANAQPLDLLGY